MTHPDLVPAYRAHLAEITARTARALAACGYDGLILQAGEPPGWFRDDQGYAYKPHADFRLWLPLLDAPGSLLQIVPGRRPRLVFFVADDFWYQPAQLPDAWWPAEFDVVTVHSRAAAFAALQGPLARCAYIGDPLPELVPAGIGAINPEHLLHRLDYARAVKTPYEIDCLRVANRIAMRGHAAAASAFASGASEFEIHQAFCLACEQREQELPYNAIVAVNEAAAVLHYQILRRERPREPRTLLLDAGASFAGYGSDVTRTSVAHAKVAAGAASGAAHDRSARDEFAALVAGLERAQQALCAEVKPGVDWRDVHAAAVRAIATLLVEAGILRCSVDEAVDGDAARLFFPHGIGHLLGLMVHDVGGFMADDGHTIAKPPRDPALRLTRVLQPGFVVTMEPGLYFIDALLNPARTQVVGRSVDWSRVERLAPYGGIRIEDNLAVTASGCENLTRGIHHG